MPKSHRRPVRQRVRPKLPFPVKPLLDAKVLDSTNRELGNLRTLIVDPQTGKLVRADIALKGGGGVMGKGGDQQISVPWEQLSVKRQEGNFVVVLNQEPMQKIQSIQKQYAPEAKQKK
jgi:sporulation protein YlmC with PRC-barrel domain